MLPLRAPSLRLLVDRLTAPNEAQTQKGGGVNIGRIDQQLIDGLRERVRERERERERDVCVCVCVIFIHVDIKGNRKYFAYIVFN